MTQKILNSFHLGNDRCPRCNDRVYYAEKVVANGINWHKVIISVILYESYSVTHTVWVKSFRFGCKMAFSALLAMCKMWKIIGFYNTKWTWRRNLLQSLLWQMLWAKRVWLWYRGWNSSNDLKLTWHVTSLTSTICWSN